MAPAGDDIDRFQLVDGHFEFDLFSGGDIPLMDEAVPGYDAELFPLGGVPMIAFDRMGFGI